MFFHSLPVLLSEHALFLYEGVAFLILLAVIFFLTAPVGEWAPADRQRPKSFYQYLWLSWQGLLPLPWVFWPFFLLLNPWIYLADFWVLNNTLSVSSWTNLHLIALPPIIWWSGSVWRASGSHHSRLWVALARLAVTLAYLEYAAKIYIFIRFPRSFFQCDEAVLNYFSCF